MKWFKHDATAHIDSKLKRVRAKYGMEGYGLYWYCLELIAKNVETHNLSFILEEDSELISLETGIHHERVEEMMRYMVDLQLFEQSGGFISCLKMATRTDEYTAKLLKKTGSTPDKLPTISGECPDKLPTVSGQSPAYKKEEKEEKDEAFGEFWSAYPRKKNKGQAEKAWKKIPLDLVPAIISDVQTRDWPSDPQYIPYPSTYLNAKGWEDEESSDPNKPGDDFL